jgi:hypothetical protein
MPTTGHESKYKKHNERNPNMPIRLRSQKEKEAVQEMAKKANKTVNKFVRDLLFPGTAGGTANPGSGITGGTAGELIGHLKFFFQLFQKNAPFKSISPEEKERLKTILALIKKVEAGASNES